MTKKPRDPIDKRVGAKVRMRRLELGLSQTDLANGIGVTFQQVQKYENGANRLGASRLLQVAGVLKVEPSFFFDDAPGSKSRSSDKELADVVEFLVSKDGLALAEAFMAIRHDKLRRGLVDLVERIAGA